TRSKRDWSSDVCSSDLVRTQQADLETETRRQLAQRHRDRIAADDDQTRQRQESFAKYSALGFGFLAGQLEMMRAAVEIDDDIQRSEERRVGKEGGGRGR